MGAVGEASKNIATPHWLLLPLQRECLHRTLPSASLEASVVWYKVTALLTSSEIPDCTTIL